MFFEKRHRVAVWSVSSAVGALAILLPILTGLYVPEKPYLIPLSREVNNAMALGLVVALLPPAFVEYSNHKWGREVDRNIPGLLRDLTESIRSGVTLPRALDEATKRDYGPLSREMERALARFILGASWEEALTFLAERLNRPSVKRLCTILIEAHQVGGRMMEVLNSSVELFSSLEEYREEKYTQMSPYTATLYMAALIFLVIGNIVLRQFLIPLAETQSSLIMGELLPHLLDIDYYRSILFWASIIESLFGGFVAGKIGDGSIRAGLRHSVVLLSITILFFNILAT
ncbi:MAG: type II secretion system F family protein [Candidatus Bathyarchaeia archaeon]